MRFHVSISGGKEKLTTEHKEEQSVNTKLRLARTKTEFDDELDSPTHLLKYLIKLLYCGESNVTFYYQ